MMVLLPQPDGTFLLQSATTASFQPSTDPVSELTTFIPTSRNTTILSPHDISGCDISNYNSTNDSITGVVAASPLFSSTQHGQFSMANSSTSTSLAIPLMSTHLSSTSTLSQTHIRSPLATSQPTPTHVLGSTSVPIPTSISTYLATTPTASVKSLNSNTQMASGEAKLGSSRTGLISTRQPSASRASRGVKTADSKQTMSILPVEVSSYSKPKTMLLSRIRSIPPTISTTTTTSSYCGTNLSGFLPASGAAVTTLEEASQFVRRISTPLTTASSLPVAYSGGNITGFSEVDILDSKSRNHLFDSEVTLQPSPLLIADKEKITASLGSGIVSGSALGHSLPSAAVTWSSKYSSVGQMIGRQTPAAKIHNQSSSLITTTTSSTTSSTLKGAYTSPSFSKPFDSSTFCSISESEKIDTSLSDKTTNPYPLYTHSTDRFSIDVVPRSAATGDFDTTLSSKASVTTNAKSPATMTTANTITYSEFSSSPSDHACQTFSPLVSSTEGLVLGFPNSGPVMLATGMPTVVGSIINATSSTACNHSNIPNKAILGEASFGQMDLSLGKIKSNLIQSSAADGDYIEWMQFSSPGQINFADASLSSSSCSSSLLTSEPTSEKSLLASFSAPPFSVTSPSSSSPSPPLSFSSIASASSSSPPSSSILAAATTIAITSTNSKITTSLQSFTEKSAPSFRSNAGSTGHLTRSLTAPVPQFTQPPERLISSCLMAHQPTLDLQSDSPHLTDGRILQPELQISQPGLGQTTLVSAPVQTRNQQQFNQSQQQHHFQQRRPIFDPATQRSVSLNLNPSEQQVLILATTSVTPTLLPSANSTLTPSVVLHPHLPTYLTACGTGINSVVATNTNNSTNLAAIYTSPSIISSVSTPVPGLMASAS
ncbi:unnamed protein product [Protopolystoma xenopodis]|uniref:Uncharacterized protein n=1 Tax=Protopolystoma xenopodis TaxID=117903 RepID=A0A3S4ZT21_9PLAT|nr:unnamed protein product [Protopolystoma xenopodis]